jgi:hypothetical protein
MKFQIKPGSKYSTLEVYLFLILSTFCMVFLVIRAISVSMTHDEIATFNGYVQGGQFLPFLAKADGNNHLLNTILTYFFYHLFGTSALVLRMSNLAFAPLFFYFLYKLSCELSSKVLGWLFFISLAFSLHLIEFLALSRGYGLAITFFLGSVWQFMKAIREGNSKDFMNSFIFMTLSSLSILTFVYSYALLATLFLFMQMIGVEKKKFRNWVALYSRVLLPMLFLFAYSAFIKAGGAWIEGKSEGLVKTSFRTLVMRILDLVFAQADKVLIVLAVMLAVPILILLIRAVLVRKDILSSNYIFLYLLAGNSIITILVSVLFHVNYPETRMAIYFYPLIIGSIVFTIDILVKQTSRVVFAILAFPLLCLPVHFFTHINAEYVVWYKYCHIPTRYYTRVMEGYKAGEMPPAVGGHGIQAFAWSYLAKQHDGVANLMETFQYPSKETEYAIIDIRLFEDWHQYYDTIDYDDISNLSLLKKKTISQFIPVTTVDSISTADPTKDEFFIVYETNISDKCGEVLEVNYDFCVNSFGNPLRGLMVICLDDSTHKNLMYNNIQMNLLRDRWDGSPHNFLKTSIFRVPESSVKMRILFWNIHKSKFCLKDGIVTIKEKVKDSTAYLLLNRMPSSSVINKD